MNKGHTDTRLISNLFFRLLPTQVLLLLVAAVNGFVSGLFGSNFAGAGVMSAIGLYGPINMFLGAVSMVLVGGSQILCGKFMGRNEPERTQAIFSLDLLITALFSAAAVIILTGGALTGLIRILASDPGTREILNQYIFGQAIGILPMLLGQQLAAFLSLENRSKRSTIASLVCIAVNIALNFLFVVILRMNAFGLALASSLGLWSFFGVQASHYFSGKSFFKLDLKQIRWSGTREIIIMGYPSALTNLYQTVRGLIVNGLIVKFVGEIGLSSFAASDSVLRLFWAVPFGMVAVSRMLIGISIGEEDRKSLTDIMRVAMYKCIPLMCAISALVMVFAVPLTRFFYRDPNDPVYEMTVMAFRLLPICMPLSIVCLHFTCYAQASGKQLLVHILSILDGVINVAGFSAILVPAMKMNGVYTANILNGVVGVLVPLIYSCVVQKQFPTNMEQLMVIPDDFGVEESARIDISVLEMAEVMNVSRQVIDFCKFRGIDERRAYFAGLFLEEMAGNVVAHGFEKDTKPHSVDIRVVHKDDDVILRIRDDCVPFDPAERKDIADPKDEVKNIGIRLVYKAAKNIQYQNILGLNVLTIRI